MNVERINTWWLGLMLLGGVAFGLYAERRPFGDGVMSHSLIVFFLIVGAALLALRFILGRPVPEIIPERRLMIGCFGALAGFLVGNALAVHGLILR